MRKFLIFVLVVFLLAGVILGVRFLFGGKEDTWICSGGQWVKHGNPAEPQPTGGCVKSPGWVETRISNPASVYCEEQGGNLEMVTASDGSQTGWCQFEDGRECEEWEFFRTKVCQSPTKQP